MPRWRWWCKDLDQTLAAYWKTFGLGPWHYNTFRKPWVREMSYRGQPGEYSMRSARAYLDKMRIEIIEVGEGNSIYADFVRQHGYGIHHLGLDVKEMEGPLAQLAAAGIDVIQDGYGYGASGDGAYAYLGTEETFGMTLELIKSPSARGKPEKLYPPE